MLPLSAWTFLHSSAVTCGDVAAATVVEDVAETRLHVAAPAAADNKVTVAVANRAAGTRRDTAAAIGINIAAVSVVNVAASKCLNV